MHALKITNARKVYHDGTEALSDVSLTVKEGEFFSLLGLNGAGKTTLIGMITGLVRKSSGKFEIFGYDLDQDRGMVRQSIGVVPQEFNFNVFNTVSENLLYNAGYFGLSFSSARQRLQEVLAMVQLEKKRDTQLRFLSGGMKRRVMIARALMSSPRLLILDEPTAGVDVDLRREIWDLLRNLNQQGVTIILTSHYMEEVEALCERVAILHQGKIVREGKIDDIKEALNQAHYRFVLDQPFSGELSLEGCRLLHQEGRSIDVCVKAEVGQLIKELMARNYQVVHVYNQTNRLEQFFLNDVGGE